jgi:hypothetical protein
MFAVGESMGDRSHFRMRGANDRTACTDGPCERGVTLWLLTSAGWIAGSLHTISDPLFTFRLPGAAERELTIQIPARALVAWSLN